MTHLAEPE